MRAVSQTRLSWLADALPLDDKGPSCCVAKERVGRPRATAASQPVLQEGRILSRQSHIAGSPHQEAVLRPIEQLGAPFGPPLSEPTSDVGARHIPALLPTCLYQPEVVLKRRTACQHAEALCVVDNLIEMRRGLRVQGESEAGLPPSFDQERQQRPIESDAALVLRVGAEVAVGQIRCLRRQEGEVDALGEASQRVLHGLPTRCVGELAIPRWRRGCNLRHWVAVVRFAATCLIVTF